MHASARQKTPKLLRDISLVRLQKPRMHAKYPVLRFSTGTSSEQVVDRGRIVPLYGAHECIV